MAPRRAATRVRPTAVERLVTALIEPGCPVCRCLEADARRDLAAFLREQTMDPAGRAALRRAGGFCAWHTSLLREAADGILSVALLAEDLLRTGLTTPVRCPTCAAQRERAAEYLGALLEVATAAVLRRGLAAGPGVPCRPHLRALHARAGRDPRLAELEPAIRPRLRRLAADLAGFIARQDYRSAEPPTREEAGAWSEALEHLAGRAKLFGSDLPRP